VLADAPIDRLAADGDRVAFIACDRVYVWTPATNSTDPSFEKGRTSCNYPDITGRLVYYDLALAGDRLVYALNFGCNSITLTLHVRVLPARRENVIDTSSGHCGAPFNPALGRLAGSVPYAELPRLSFHNLAGLSG
jgi:hypothetical protein